MKKLLLCSLLILGACSVVPESKKSIDAALDDAKSQLPAEALRNAKTYSREGTGTEEGITVSNTYHAIINNTHYSIISTTLYDGTANIEGIDYTFDKEIVYKYAVSTTLEEIEPIPTIKDYTPQSGDKYYKSTAIVSKTWSLHSEDPNNNEKWVDNKISDIDYYIIRQTDSELRIMEVVGAVENLSLDDTTIYKKI